jgi:hypothetical protein
MYHVAGASTTTQNGDLRLPATIWRDPSSVGCRLPRRTGNVVVGAICHALEVLAPNKRGAVRERPARRLSSAYRRRALPKPPSIAHDVFRRHRLHGVGTQAVDDELDHGDQIGIGAGQDRQVEMALRS